jgi:hypothetical protein
MASLVALYLLVVVYVYLRDILWLNIAAAVFVAGMVGTCVTYGRRSASRLGWSRRYSVGFSFSALIFGLGMALLDLTDFARGLALDPLCRGDATATPGGRRRVRRSA